MICTHVDKESTTMDEDRRDGSRQEFQRLYQEGSQIWTPGSIFHQCCVKWLIDGPAYIPGPYDDGYIPPNRRSPRNGCNDLNKCKKDHPTIKLHFDGDTKSTTAVLSHELDPFLRYFQGLVEEGKAEQSSLKVYLLRSYLRPVEAAINSYDGFGSHLVRVAEGSRKASDLAQSLELEERERASKRPRLKSNGDDNVSDSSDSSDRLLEKAIGVVLENGYLQNDHVALYCMRMVCKSFNSIALSAAYERIQTVKLFITPLVNGKMQYGEYWMCGYDTETYSRESDSIGETRCVKYTKMERMSFGFEERGGVKGHYPVNTAGTFNWDSGTMLRQSDLYEDEDEYHSNSDRAEYAYHGNILRVYWQPDEADPVDVPERKSIYDQEKPSLGLLVAQFDLPRDPETGIATTSTNRVTVQYQVLESNSDETEEVIEEEEFSDAESVEDEYPDEESGDGSSRSHGGIIKRTQYIQFSGEAKLLMAKIDYGILVIAHARRIQKELSCKHGDTLRERPLTQAENEYFDLISNVAYKY